LIFLGAEIIKIMIAILIGPTVESSAGSRMALGEKFEG